MEFKVGDIVKRKKEGMCGEWERYCGKFGSSLTGNYRVVGMNDFRNTLKIDMNGHHEGGWMVTNFELVENGKVPKLKPVDKHIVMEDNCNNSQGVFNSYEDAVTHAKELSGKMTIYRLFEVAKVESQRKVTKVKPETKKKTRKR